MRRILTLLTLMASLFLTASLHATTANVTLGWNASTSSNVTSYMIYYGTSSGSYITAVPVSNVTNVTIRGLTAGKRYYFAATSLNSSGVQSAFSPEISGVAIAQGSPPPLMEQYSFNFTGSAGNQYVVLASTNLVNWVPIQTNTGSFTFTDSNVQQYSRRFFRTVPVSN